MSGQVYQCACGHREKRPGKINPFALECPVCRERMHRVMDLWQLDPVEFAATFEAVKRECGVSA